MTKNIVLESIEPFIGKTTHVKINEKKIDEFVEGFDKSNFKHWINYCPFDISMLEKEDKLNFLAVFNSISFSYWGNPKWTITYEGKTPERGTWAMIGSLKRAIDKGKPILDFSYLSNLKREDLEEILRGNTEIPLLKERLNHLNDLGLIVSKNYDGKFSKVIEKSDNDALKLVDLIVSEISSFDDSTIYKEKKIYFYKRAQLLASDVSQIVELKNVSKLTSCPDYKNPLYLQDKGIIEYSKEFACKVKNRIPFSKDGEEASEMRICTIGAFKKMSEKMNVTQMQLNDFGWIESQNALKSKNYPLIRTTDF
ncbi:MAG: queuosine salvage family protein [archaeon]